MEGQRRKNSYIFDEQEVLPYMMTWYQNIYDNASLNTAERYKQLERWIAQQRMQKVTRTYVNTCSMIERSLQVIDKRTDFPVNGTGTTDCTEN